MSEIIEFLKNCKFHPASFRLVEFPEEFEMYILQNAIKFGYLSRYVNLVMVPDTAYYLTEKGKGVL